MSLLSGSLRRNSLLLILMLLGNFAQAQSNNYEALWKEIDALEAQQLTKDALAKTEQLISKAKKESNTAQLVKGINYLVRYKVAVEEDGGISNTIGVREVKKYIADANDVEKAILQSALADLYYGYYQNYRYKIYSITPVADTVEDFTLWDARRISSEIVKLYEASLSNAKALQLLPLENYLPIVENPKANGAFVITTLYDLLAFKTIRFFSDSDIRMAEVKDAYEMNAPFLMSAAENFAKQKIQSADSLSFDLKTIQLYQQWLAFKLTQNNPAALVEADLMRLAFVNVKYTGDNKDILYIDALTQLRKKYTGTPQEAEIVYQLAALYKNIASSPENNLGNQGLTYVQIVALCDDVIKKYPTTTGAQNCKYLKAVILRKSFSVNIENAVIPQQAAKVLVTYHNIKQLNYMVVKLPNDFEPKGLDSPKDAWKFLTKNKAVFSSLWKLPATEDLKEHSVEAYINGLPEGRYALLVYAGKPNTASDYSSLNINYFWSTRLALTTQLGAETHNLIVNDRLNGKALSDVNVKIYTNNYNYNKRKYEKNLVKEANTDALGAMSFQNLQQNYVAYRAQLKKGTDEFHVMLNSYYNPYRGGSELPGKAEVLHKIFTDRAIYRPGQTVFYKVIAILQDQNKFSAITQQQLVVFFKDVNGEIVAKDTITTNEMGSGAGSFIIPASGLTGSMSLFTDKIFETINVEEYKRPKFEVVFDTLKAAYRLNDTIEISGNAKAYSGAVVDGAQVKFTVKRTGRYLWWCFWGYGKGIWPMSRAEKIIETGTVTTDEAGNFKISFVAHPDKSLDASMKPYFDYTITADVTDITGETQSGEQSLTVGYLSIEPEINISQNWVDSKPGAMTLSAKNLQQQPADATFEVQIYPFQKLASPLKSRYWSAPDQFLWSKAEHDKVFPYEVYKNEDVPSGREKGKSIFSQKLEVKGNAILQPFPSGLKPGWYLVEAQVKDKSGEVITLKKEIEVLNTDGSSADQEFLDVKISETVAEPGDTVYIILKAALPETYVSVQGAFKGEKFLNETVKVGVQQVKIPVVITEKWLGGIDVQYHSIIQNRSFGNNFSVQVVKEKLNDLSVEWSVFRDKLLPGQKEKWQLKIKGLNGDRKAAEVLASLYDASLDAFRKHNFDFSLYPRTYFGMLPKWKSESSFGSNNGDLFNGKKFQTYPLYISLTYPEMIRFDNYYGYELQEVMVAASSIRGVSVKSKSVKREPLMSADFAVEEAPMDSDGDGIPIAIDKEDAAPAPEVPAIKFRSNFNETAFFMPQLKTDAAGNVVFEFTMPESLTRWKLLGLAHTPDMHYANFSETVTTSQPLMITPNVPRIVREGDTIYIVAKIANLSESIQSGSATLIIKNTENESPITSAVVVGKNDFPFVADIGRSTSVMWKLFIPDGLKAITYEVSARSGDFTDGETAAIPVLPRRQLVTQTLPIWMNQKGKDKFTFSALQNATSSTIKNEALTFEWSSRPVWYVLRALPALNESEEPCVDVIFHRYFANAISTHILQQNPAFKTVLEDWKAKGSPESPLYKNQELKNILLNETPWLSEAAGEKAQQEGILKLLNPAENAATQKKAIQELAKLQSSNGGLVWLAGMPESRYLTQYVAGGFGRLLNLGVIKSGENKELDKMLSAMIEYLDSRLADDLKNIKKSDKDYKKNNHLWPEIASYLYIRSFYKSQKVSGSNQEAHDYFMEQAATHWTKVNEYNQAMIAIALDRNGDAVGLKNIMPALLQNAVVNDEKGIYWKNLSKSGWYWYQAPVESHALLAEAFEVVAHDRKTADGIRTWILRQKQTTRWNQNAATAMACYSLLLGGTDWTAPNKKETITIGNTKLMPNEVESGTGYFKKQWNGSEIKPSLANIEIQKSSSGPAWGAMYWQYWEDMEKIPAATNEVGVVKKFFKVVNTDAGEQLQPITESTPLQIGDKVRVRLDITSDRNLEFVHIKDGRATGLEPTNTISSYEYKGGLGYYMSTKDAATHFYVDFLPRGKYVLEYTLMVNNAGDYQGGICNIECLYAPEFQSNSKGMKLKVPVVLKP